MSVDEGLAVIIAAVLAIMGIFYASRQQRKMLRKQHTYKVIDKLNDWPEFDKNLDFAANLIKTGTIPKMCEPANKTDCDKLDFLLNYYEFLASAIICGDVDEELVKRVEQGRLCRVYLKFIAYVQENREDRGSNTIWENLEFICYRWQTMPNDVYETSLERLLLRPSTSHFHCERDRVRAYLEEKATEIE